MVRELSLELHPEFIARPLYPESSLAKDAGIDSLARIELLLRIDRKWSVALPEEIGIAADSVAELARAIAAAQTGGSAAASLPASVGSRLDAVRTSQAATRTTAAGGSVREPARAGTLVEVIELHAHDTPDQTAIRLIGGAEAQLSYRDIWDGAAEVALGLRERGLNPGRAVAMMLPTSTDYILTFFGILLAGGVPVPVYPPLRMAQLEEHLLRRIAIFKSARAEFLVVMPEAQTLAPLLLGHLPDLRAVLSPGDLRSHAGRGEHVRPRETDTAFMQFTSGSTGRPKGVVLSHANLLANIRAMGQAAQIKPKDVLVSWLPLYHDMGLIGAIFTPLYFGLPIILMSPLYFMARPIRWLRAISEHHGTLSAAPNFAYELCAHRISDEELSGLDLSSWRMALNGAEPVSVRTLEDFTKRFQACGFSAGAMAPVYGLAENCVGLSFPPPARGPRIEVVSRTALEETGIARPPRKDQGEPELRVPGCGFALPGHSIRVADARDRDLPERTVGRLQFRGPSATAGYFQNPAATKELIHPDGWLDTGDLGYLADGEVFITGRAKELIIRGGRNIYPYELEEELAELPGIRSGAVAVFGVAEHAGSPESGAGESLVVVIETRDQDAARRAQLREAVVERTIQVLGFAPDDVVLAGLRTVLRTSSGKIRRSAIRDLYLQRRIGQERSPWIQKVRLLVRGAPAALRRVLASAGRLLFTGWVRLVVFLAAPIAYPLITLAPGSLRWPLLRGVGRLLFGLAGVRVRIEGREHLDPMRPLIVVANHASYLDGLLVALALRTPLLFVAKAEFRNSLLAGRFLRSLGVRFVERFRAGESIRDEAGIEAATTTTTRPVVFFPEGTFTGSDGLRQFRMGAFVDAVHTGALIQPVALRGSRHVLRGDALRPRHGTVEVEILPVLHPQGTGWAEALRLRNAVRRQILDHCGEPDLIGAQ